MWVKLDDELHGHPKIIRAGNAGAGLFVRALTYSAKYGLDGHVPAAWVQGAVGPEDPPDLAKRLVDVGLWVVDGDGYRAPDFLEFNPSAREAKAISDARREAGRRGAAARWNGDR